MNNCKTCVYFDPRTMKNDDGTDGECLRYPPTVVSTGPFYEPKMFRPQVQSYDGCGEHSPIRVNASMAPR